MITSRHLRLLRQNNLYELVSSIPYDKRYLDAMAIFLKKYWLLYYTSDKNMSWDTTLDFVGGYAPDEGPARKDNDLLSRKSEISCYKMRVDEVCTKSVKHTRIPYRYDLKPGISRKWMYFNIRDNKEYISAEDMRQTRADIIQEDRLKKRLYDTDLKAFKDGLRPDKPRYLHEDYVPMNPGSIVVVYENGYEEYLDKEGRPETDFKYGADSKGLKRYYGPKSSTVKRTYRDIKKMFRFLTTVEAGQDDPIVHNNEEYIEFLKFGADADFCTECGKVFTTFNNPSKVCPECGGYDLANELVGNETHMDYIQYEQDYEEEEEEEDNNWNDIND